VLDHPHTVHGRRVLDLAAGCGQASIAAALAGAASVEANDTDPYAHRAIMLNAHANDVTITASHTDLLDTPAGHPDVILAGDVFYTKTMAHRVQQFLQRAITHGTRILIGDPGRAFLPHHWLQALTTYSIPTTDGTEGAAGINTTTTQVLQPRTTNR